MAMMLIILSCGFVISTGSGLSCHVGFRENLNWKLFVVNSREWANAILTLRVIFKLLILHFLVDVTFDSREHRMVYYGLPRL